MLPGRRPMEKLGRNKGTEGIKLITEVIQKNEVHVESRLIASVPLMLLSQGAHHGDTFHWGTVLSDFDPKGGFSSIVIRFFHAT